MAGKFYVKDVNDWTKEFDNFVDAEAYVKQRRANSPSDDRFMIVQGVATVAKPVDNVFTTVL